MESLKKTLAEKAKERGRESESGKIKRERQKEQVEKRAEAFVGGLLTLHEEGILAASLGDGLLEVQGAFD